MFLFSIRILLWAALVLSRHRPWLAGVCAHSADRLGCNVYAVRAAAVLLALIWPLATAGVYLLAAWWLRCKRRGQPESPRRSGWAQRMEDIDREWERYQRR